MKVALDCGQPWRISEPTRNAAARQDLGGMAILGKHLHNRGKLRSQAENNKLRLSEAVI